MIFIIIFIMVAGPLYGQDQNDIIKLKDFNLFLFVLFYKSERPAEKEKKESVTKNKPEISKFKEYKKETGQPKKEGVSTAEASLYNSGLQFYKAKNYDESQSVFIELLQKYPDTAFKAQSTFYLGQIMFEKGQKDQALMYYNKLSEEYPKISLAGEAVYKSAQIYYEDKKYSEGLKSLLNFQKKYPQNKLIDESYVLLGDMYRKKGEMNSAAKMYQAVVEKYPKSNSVDQALFKLGDLYENEKDVRNFEMSLNYYERIVKSFPDSEFLEPARERIEFIKKNFLEYR
ncbi:MAG: tetratricopeptide repeat protein [Spirochaetes bacterium]|nr:tetratricopeptide repeat protein [Spirochaetota bacterium]